MRVTDLATNQPCDRPRVDIENHKSKSPARLPCAPVGLPGSRDRLHDVTTLRPSDLATEWTTSRPGERPCDRPTTRPLDHSTDHSTTRPTSEITKSKSPRRLTLFPVRLPGFPPPSTYPDFMNRPTTRPRDQSLNQKSPSLNPPVDLPGYRDRVTTRPCDHATDRLTRV